MGFFQIYSCCTYSSRVFNFSAVSVFGAVTTLHHCVILSECIQLFSCSCIFRRFLIFYYENNASVNKLTKISLCLSKELSLWYIPKCGLAVLQSIWIFTTYCQSAFQSICTITFPSAMYENSCAPRPHQHFILSDFSIIANLMAVKWNLLNIFVFNIPNN